jgi:decaprenylphospho-beta-D-erythro-pentofuranosid-2-ulose 2-reductase
MAYVLIVSAGSDMASACAQKYASHGYDLLLTSREPQKIKTLLSDLEIRHQVKAECLKLDILNYSEHDAFIKSVFEKADQLEGVIIFCGYLGDQQLAQQNFAESEKIIDSNFSGIVSLLNPIANIFEQRGSGFIIAVSSVAGERGRKSNYIYGASKAALTAYLSGLRNRLQDKGVKVITVKPGFVNTQMTAAMDLPKALTAEATEVAEAIFNAQKNQRDVIYVKKIWWLIMYIIRCLPEFIFKKTDL